MANEVNANIRVNLDASQALSSLQSLQSKISAFNKSVIQTNAQAVAAQKSLNSTLAAQVGSSRQFTTSLTTVENGVGRLQGAIDKNKLSMGEYFRYGVASSKTFGKVFKQEHIQMTALATERVKRLQTQYLALGAAQNGMTKAMAVRPMHLFNADMAIGIQRQQLFNKLLTDGSTSIVNWGKNTQWAGRQLMVGFTIPLTIFGAAASKVFMQLEKEAINFRKVYGDIFTTEAEVQENLAAVKELSSEMTKYGIAVKDTMALAGVAAQAGLRSADLMSATTQATRLAVLGQMEQAEAMQTIISMQTAFQQSNDELAESVDFLNIIENQTVLSLQDVAGAIPRVAPVIKGMGGDIKDLAVLLVAMREGGVSAAEGANALKNSLARLVDPTTKAIKVAKEFGIDLATIVERNRGEVLPTIMELAKAMGELEGVDEQKLLATIFGKFQYARIGALMKNIRDDSSQAARAMDLMGMSAEQLAQTADQELSVVEEAISTKFTAAMEKAKLAIAPIGEIFLKIATPILNVIGDLFEKFNDLSPTVKNFATILIAGIGIAAPAIIMLIGLFGNLIGNGLKIVAVFARFFSKLKNGSDGVKYLSGAQLDAAASAASLEGRTTSLTASLNVQRGAVNSLTRAYQSYAGAARSAAASLPQGFAGPAPMVARRMARGGVVGGTGNRDSEPALLMPGEFVINAKASKQFAPILAAINNGDVGKFANGRVFDVGGQQIALDVKSASTAAAIERRIASAAKLGDDALRKLADVLNGLSGKITSVGKQIDPAIRKVSELAAIPPTEKRYGAPAFLQKQSEKMTWGTKDAEIAAMQSEVAKKWPDIAKDTDKMRNLTNTQTSHIKVMDSAGKSVAKDWTNFSNLTPDLGGINNYLNRVKGMEMSAGDILKIQKDTGLTANQVHVEMAKLKNQVHPTTVQAQKVLASMAKIDEEAALTALAMKKTRTRIGTTVAGGYQATAVAAGLSARDMSQFSTTLGQRQYVPAAAGMVQGATAAARTAQQSASASKVMAKVGDEFGQGFATGINRQRGAVQASARGLVLGGAAAAQQQARLSSSQMRGAIMIGQGARMAPYGGLPVAPAGVQARIASAAAGGAGGGGGRPPTFLGMPGMGPEGKGFSNAVSQTTSSLTKLQSGIKNVGTKMMGTSMALSGVAFGLSMMDNKVGEFAQKMMPAIFALTGVQMALPMLAKMLPLFANPLGAAALAIGAVIGGFWFVKKTSDDVARRGKELAQAMYGTSQSMKDTATFFDRKTFSQQLEGMRATKAAGGREITEEEKTAARQYVESGAGQEILRGIRVAQESGGREMAAQALQNQLKRMIVSGAIAPEMADAIALELATELNDREIGFKTIANIRKIIGPDGVDIEDSEIRLKIITEIIADSDPVSDAMAQAGLIWDGSSWFSQVAMVITGAGTVDIFAENLAEQVQQQRNMISEEIDALTVSFSQSTMSVKEFLESIKAIEGAAPQFDYAGLMQAGFDQFGDDFDASAQDRLGQSLIDSLWEAMKKQMGNKQADELFFNFKEEVVLETQDIMNMMTGEMEKIDIKTQVNLFDPENVRQTVENLRELGREQDAIDLEKKFDIVMNLSAEVAAGEISPAAIQSILDSGGDVIDAYMALSLNAVKFPNEDTRLLFMAAQKVLDEDSLTLPIIIELRQKGDFKNLAKLSELTLRAEQLEDVDIDIEIQISGSDYEEIERSISRVEEFDKLAKKKNVERLVKYAEDNFGLVRSNIKDWDSLPDVVRKQRVMTYVDAFLKLRQEFTDSGDLQRTMSQLGAAGAAIGASGVADRFASVGATTAAQKTEEPKGPGVKDEPESGGSKSGKDKEKTWLENLLEEIQANLKLFVGKLGQGIPPIIQKLRNLNIPEKIIDAVGAGPEGLKRAKELLKLSKEEREKLIKDWAKSNIGEFLVKQAGELKKAKDVSAARNKLQNMTIDGRQIEKSVVDLILKDETAILTILKGSNKEIETMIKNYRQIATELDPIQTKLEELKDRYGYLKITAEIDFREARFQKAFNEIDRLYKPQIKLHQGNIKGLEKQKKEVEKQVEGLQRLQQQDQRRIRGLQRQITMLERQKASIQKQIDAIEYQNELDQRRINVLKRQDDIRKRTADALTKELEEMSRQEQKIQETYDKRIKALDKVVSLNDYILSQQRAQLGLSQAISTGDIYAATAAAQQMRQESGQFAQQQLRTGLEVGKDNAISGLRTSGGLSRKQAEEEIYKIQQQSYEVSLKIRDIEDEIYERSLQLLPLKDQLRLIDSEIEQIRAAILEIEDIMYDRETQILDIEQNQLMVINDQLRAEQEMLDEINDKIQTQKDSLTIDSLTYEQHQDMIQAFQDEWKLLEANAKLIHAMNAQVSSVAEAWEAAAKNAEAYWNAVAGGGAGGTMKPPAPPALPSGRLPDKKSPGGEVARQRKRDADDIAREASVRQGERSVNRESYANFVLEGGSVTTTAAGRDMGYGGIPASQFAENSPSLNKYAGGMIKGYMSGGKIQKYPMGGLIPYALGGGVPGDGARDSVHTILTPGEFVVRKSMVEKYGTPMMRAINQGALAMPTYSMPQKSYGNISQMNMNDSFNSVNMPVYNNYDMKFAVNGTNASADEIANKVMVKMKQVQNMQIRSNRG